MEQRTVASQTFKALAESMRRDFEQAGEVLDHRGLRGHARETVLVEQFLEKYLPRTLLVRRNAQVLNSSARNSRCHGQVQGRPRPSSPKATPARTSWLCTAPTANTPAAQPPVNLVADSPDHRACCQSQRVWRARE